MAAEAQLRVGDERVDIALALPSGRLTIDAGHAHVEVVEEYAVADVTAFGASLERLIDAQARGVEPFPAGGGRVELFGEGRRTGLRVRRALGGPLRVEGLLDDPGVHVTAWVQATPAVLGDLAEQVATALSALRR